MADLTGSTIAQNYVKALETSQLGTRQLVFYVVSLGSVQTNYTNSNSTYAKAVRGIQMVAETFLIGQPAAGKFVVAVALNTAAGSLDPAGASGYVPGDAPQDITGTNTVIKTAIDAATGGTSTVYFADLIGDTLTYNQ